ncbi:MAG: LapA family protein [Planctomycetota bacterium]|nr:LapA family protein [Planctomycetota bacterium]
MIQKLKVAGIAVLALLVLIVVLQNTDAVETNILFFTITMPGAALIFGAAVVGFIIGVFTAGKLLTRMKAKAK